jgi:hypothetical protein
MLRALSIRSVAAADVAAAEYAQQQDVHLQLPFSGKWFVMQGGDTINVNQHMATGAQAFGIDFAKVGGAGDRQLSSSQGPPARLEDFYSWGEAVLSPADGTIVSVASDRTDNTLGTKDAAQPAGNHVVIKTGAGKFIYVAHMQRGSVLVKAGDPVTAGQLIGKCGNSGNSDFPHIHLHIQDTPTLNLGRGQNPVFGLIEVELNGMHVDANGWPLIRGLFVSNKSARPK